MNELRFAFRGLRRAHGYGLVLVATLALGVGVNSAIFNVAWQVLLEPLPFPDQHRLVRLWEGFGPARQKNPVAPATFLDWQRDGRSFEAVAAYNRHRSALNLTGAGEPAELDITYVTESFFSVLGIPAVDGRPILPGDAATDTSLLVLSEHVWRQRFGGDPAIVGRVVRLHGEPFDVIGVMSDAAALGSAPTDAWVRMPLRGEQARMRQAHYLNVVARLRPGVTLAQADDDVRRITEAAFARFAQPGVAESARATDFRGELTGGVRPALLVLLGSAGLVLLIACVNVSGLQLSRRLARRRDFAIQAALGASRGRQIRVQLAEAAILSVPAGGLGLLLGAWLLAVVGTAAPALVGLRLRTSPGAVVIAFTSGLSILAGLACATASASGWRESGEAWLSTRGATADRASSPLRTALVSLQVALSVLVLVGAALLVSSLWRVLSVDPGFTFDRGLIINVDLPETAYADAAARAEFFARAAERLNGISGVRGVCGMTSAPLVPGTSMTWVPEGESRLVGSEPIAISPDCFSVLGIPLLRGRTFARNEPAPVTIVSQSLARRLFGAGDAVGRRVHLGVPDGPLFTVVGVVGDIRKTSFETSYTQQAWLPDSSPLFPPRQLVVRTSVPPAPLTEPIRAAIREIDPNLPVNRVATMAAARADMLAERRFNMLLLLTYGMAGLTLCAVGVFGLLSQAVGQRTREIGVRMALGAKPGDVVRHVVLGTLAAVIAGCALGAVGAALASRFLRNLLFQVSPTDPALYGAVVALVLAVALVAAYLPARRAARIDPLLALRAQ